MAVPVIGRPVLNFVLRAYINWNSHVLERPKNHELSELRPYSASSFVLELEERMDEFRNFP